MTKKSPKDDDLTLKPPKYKDIIALTFDFFKVIWHMAKLRLINRVAVKALNLGKPSPDQFDG